MVIVVVLVAVVAEVNNGTKQYNPSCMASSYDFDIRRGIGSHHGHMTVAG